MSSSETTWAVASERDLGVVDRLRLERRLARDLCEDTSVLLRDHCDRSLARDLGVIDRLSSHFYFAA